MKIITKKDPKSSYYASSNIISEYWERINLQSAQEGSDQIQYMWIGTHRLTTKSTN